MVMVDTKKKRGPKPGSGGRPKKEFDYEQFEELCNIDCTLTEIEAVMRLDHKTLYRMVQEHYGETFSQIFAAKKESGKASLRRIQLQHAEKNVAMAIWLGKQRLGQREPGTTGDVGEGIADKMANMAKLISEADNK